MEWVPKLYDTLDSMAFELRMRWAGYIGERIRGLVVLAAVLLLSGLSPVFRIFAVAVIASFIFAEIVLGKARTTWRVASR